MAGAPALRAAGGSVLAALRQAARAAAGRGDAGECALQARALLARALPLPHSCTAACASGGVPAAGLTTSSQSCGPAATSRALAGGPASPPAAASSDPLLSDDGGVRMASPRSGDLADAAARAPALRLLQRYFNVGIPGLRGQAILARVVRGGGGSGGGARASGGGSGGSSGGSVVLDPGYYGLSVMEAEDLGGAQLYTAGGAPRAAAGGGEARPGSGEGRLRRGAYVRVRLGDLYTPYGDVQLEPVRVRPEVRRKLVWGELRGRMRRGTPVWGRVLNPCAGGYAVGVAGYVALLPSRQAFESNIQQIGVLHQFYIHRMEERGRRIELSNYASGGGSSGGGGGGGGGGAGAGLRPLDGAAPELWSNL